MKLQKEMFCKDARAADRYEKRAIFVYIEPMAGVIHITRRERFSASHKLWQPEWSDEKNFEVFGKCANPNWHGHNYDLFVTIKGPVRRDTGYVADLKDLSNLIREKIIKKTDHKNLNLDVDFLKGVIASTENVAVAIWNELSDDIRAGGGTLHCVKLCETENNYVEYYGD